MLGFASEKKTSTRTASSNRTGNFRGPQATESKNWDIGCLEALQPRHWLFRVGDVKDYAYRIEAGAVLIAHHAVGGPLLKTRIASRGEVVGLGFLTHHRSSAAAITASTVFRYTPEQVDELCVIDQDLCDQRDAAIHDEFDQIRSETTATSINASLTFRLANFLLVASRFARLEGRDPHLGSDDLDLNQLVVVLGGEPLEMLTALHELERSSAVASHGDGKIKITNLERLERLCGTRA